MNKIELAYQKGYRVSESGDLISPKGIILSPCFNKDGYKQSSFKINGKTISYQVHRLMAYQKYNDLIFDNGVQVRHLNSNKSDNSVNNISIGTASQNMMDKPKEVRISSALKATSFIRKYDHLIVNKFYEENGFIKTMQKFNISSKGTLSYIINKSLTGRVNSNYRKRNAIS